MCILLDNFELRKWKIDVQVAQQQGVLRGHTELHGVQDFSAIFSIDAWLPAYHILKLFVLDL